MTWIEMGAQPSGQQGPVQAGRSRPAAGVWLGCLALLAGASALGGCSSAINTFHRMEGGQIAQPRQPPPGLDKAYPNLASVPARPPAADQAALQQISNALIADRLHAQHMAEAAPLPDPSSPAASPQLFGVGTVAPPQSPETPGAQPPGPAPGQPAASATMAAASPPANSPAQSAAGATPGATVPSATSLAAGPPTAASAARPPGEGPIGAVAAGIVPPVGSLPPSDEPPAPLPPGPAPLPANPANTVDVPFAPESASVPPISGAPLRALAAKRGNKLVAAIGHGEATAADPAAQSAAVALGLKRAQAIAAALTAAGVPQSAIRIGAEAGGRGGAAQLIQ